jgi:hypothetical protein
MLSKSFAWVVIGIVGVAAAWWLLDPVGFSQNPVFSWLSLRSQGYHRN